MKVAEARKFLLTTVRNDGTSYHNDELDNALLTAGHELVRAAPTVSKTSTTLTVTANVAEIDLSSVTDFKADRFLTAEIGYNDRTTWLTATAYVVNDMVQGDGTPDNKFYFCTEDHTSDSANEPGASTSTVWSQIDWTGGFQLKRCTYLTVAQLLSRQAGNYYGYYPISQDHLPRNNAPRPSQIGFRDDDTAYLWDVPEAAWKLTLYWTQPFSLTTTINISDEYLHPMITWGAAAVLLMEDPTNPDGSAVWNRFLQWASEVSMTTTTDTGVILRTED